MCCDIGRKSVLCSAPRIVTSSALYNNFSPLGSVPSRDWAFFLLLLSRGHFVFFLSPRGHLHKLLIAEKMPQSCKKKHLYGESCQSQGKCCHLMWINCNIFISACWLQVFWDLKVVLQFNDSFSAIKNCNLCEWPLTVSFLPYKRFFELLFFPFNLAAKELLFPSQSLQKRKLKLFWYFFRRRR